MSNKIRVFMGIPSLGKRSDQQMYVLRQLEAEYKDRIELVYPDFFAGRIFHDCARNHIVKDFLKSGCDVLWFLDSDIVPHHDILELFNNIDQWDMAGCPYPVFMTPERGQMPRIVMCVYKRDETGKFRSAAVPQSGTEYVDGIATGCIFIKRHVFDKIEDPVFEFKYDEKMRDLKMGEDLNFCHKTADLGYKFFINYAYVCRHYKEVDLLDVNNYALDYGNKVLESHDKQVRTIITERNLAMLYQKQQQAKAHQLLHK